MGGDLNKAADGVFASLLARLTALGERLHARRREH
jgi:hypothetical protein